MSADIRLLFVGGPEDGLYHVMPEGTQMWKVPERKELTAVLDDNGRQPCSEEFKRFVYIRRGNAMFFDL